MRKTGFQLNKHMVITILALAWPTMFEQLMQTAVQYVDTAMVGSLGTYATAAVGATTTVNWLINSSISALSIGFLSFIAQRLGAQDSKGAKRASAQAVLAVAVCGVFFTVLTLSLSGFIPVWMQVDPAIRELSAQYFFILYLPMLPRTATIIFGTVLRSAGDSKTPMKIGIVVNLLNVVLNFIMIYPARVISLWGRGVYIPGMGMGVLGAAAASAIAFAVGGICITVVLWKHPVISPRGERFAADLEILKPCLKVALPNMLQRFATSFGYVAFAAMINSLGEVATAAHTIANTVESAFYIPGYGMQTAAATLAGYSAGEKNEKHLMQYSSTIMFIATLLMTLLSTALFLFAEPIMSIFTPDRQVVELGGLALRIVAVSEPFFAVLVILEGIFSGLGDTKAPFVFSLISMWGVRLTSTWLCVVVFKLGLGSVWLCMSADNIFRFSMMMVRFLRGKWKKGLHFIQST